MSGKRGLNAIISYLGVLNVKLKLFIVPRNLKT